MAGGPSFCRIFTDTGLYGDGEVALSYGIASKAAFSEMAKLAPMLIGMNPLEHEVIWQKLYQNSFFGLNAGPIIFGAISAFDIALWDIKGKRYHAPLWEMLGGKQRDRLPAYARQLQMGYGQLILENHALTDKLSATQYGLIAKKYGILYFEEPVKPDPDLVAYVHKHTGLNIAFGERMYSRWEFRRAFDRNSIQIAQPDICVAGGVTEVKKICDMAYTDEVGVQIHVAGSNLATAVSLNLEAVIPNFVIHEYNVNTEMPKMLRLTKYDYEPANGVMSVPDRPGIGNEISDYVFAHSQVVTVQ